MKIIVNQNNVTPVSGEGKSNLVLISATPRGWFVDAVWVSAKVLMIALKYSEELKITLGGGALCTDLPTEKFVEGLEMFLCRTGKPVSIIHEGSML